MYTHNVRVGCPKARHATLMICAADREHFVLITFAFSASSLYLWSTSYPLCPTWCRVSEVAPPVEVYNRTAIYYFTLRRVSTVSLETPLTHSTGVGLYLRCGSTGRSCAPITVPPRRMTSWVFSMAMSVGAAPWETRRSTSSTEMGSATSRARGILLRSAVCYVLMFFFFFTGRAGGGLKGYINALTSSSYLHSSDQIGTSKLLTFVIQ